MWMRLLLHGPKGVKNNPPLMLLPIIRRHGTHSEYLLLQIHYLLIQCTGLISLRHPVKESGAWLNALPVRSLGLRMDDATMRISMGLRLGLPLCQSHTCQHCGAEVSQFATHGLSCRKCAGRHHRHSAVSDIIYRALVAAHAPSHLEPSGLYRSDGKQPDGVSIVPWKCG